MDAKPDLSWADLRLLLEVQRRGTLLAAARALGVATSTVSRRLSAFEARLGVALLDRRMEGVALTPQALELARFGEVVDHGLAAKLRDVGGAQKALAGVIRVTAGDGYARALAQAIGAFLEQHPRLSFEVCFDPRRLNLVEREADVGLRAVHVGEESLVYRRLPDVEHGLYAAPSFLARAGVPRTVEDLRRMPLVGFDDSLPNFPATVALRDLGARRFVYRCDAFTGISEAVRAGVGVAVMPHLVADGLVRVLPGLPLPAMPMWLVMHRELKKVRHIRAFADHLRKELSRATGSA